MIRAFYSAGSGLSTQQLAMNTAGNNIANANTTGFKKQSVGFSELVYSNRRAVEGDIKVGNGVRDIQMDTVFTQGALEPTDRELDFAIIGEGFFGVLGQDGTVAYTRDGNFQVSVEETGNYLVTSTGEYILGADGDRLSADSNQLLNEIGIFTFDNESELEHLGNNMYLPTELSGEAVVSAGELAQSYLERSNVDMADEMSDLITIQRAFQFNARLLQTADELEQITNTLR